MPEENLNEPENQPQDQPGPESLDQPGPESDPELSPFDRVLQKLPEDERRAVEEATMRQKAFTQKTQKFSEERKRFEQQMSENQGKVDFYNRFRDDASFRQEVLASMGAPKSVQKSDNLDEQYAEAQELINDLDPKARKAMQILIKKNIRDEIKPFRDKVSEFERQQTESQQRKQQKLQLEKKQVFQDFAQEHPDYVEVEPQMQEIIGRFPGFFNQSPAKLKKAFRDVYNLATMPRQQKKAKEQGIKQMLNQNTQAQNAAKKASPRPAPGKTYGNNGQEMDFDECFNLGWSEKVGG